jgi:hypothetical protein
MSLGGFRRYRRLAGAFALAGMAFYAVLVPWHILSQATTPLFQSDLAKSFKPPCHESSAGSKNRQPLKQTNCPICNGFAALHFAVIAPLNVLPVRVVASALLPPMVEDKVTDASVRTPRSRGPPPSI